MNFSISFIAMNRMVEERAAKDEAYRRQLKRNRKCTLSDGRALPDDVLLERLRSLGLEEASREWLDHFSRKAPSAQVLATALLERGLVDVTPDQEDWVWISLVCLWERWFADRVNLEMLDDWMQAGYVAKDDDQPLETARIWLRVWRGVEQFMESFEIETLEEFDEWFGGTQSVFNWVQDCSLSLYNAALDDRSFAHERLALCRAVLALAEKSEHGGSLIRGFRHDLAESHADLGEYEAVDRLYTEWLRDDPNWGWGWIGWSDAYNPLHPTGFKDAAKAEHILKDGLAVSEVHDREYLVERLAFLYQQTGRSTEADALLRPHDHGADLREVRLDAHGQEQKRSVELENQEYQQPATSIRNARPKVGRNDPCPCGSGRKYKKCCGAK